MRFIWLLMVVFVAGCGGGRYQDRHDSTPPPIDPSLVKDAVVRVEPISPGGNKSPYTVNGVTYKVLPSAAGYREDGVASWYGSKFHGHQTSNGEIFDVYAATAAHKSLPLPSFVRVTNLQNNRSVIVRVNDRGPFHPGRIIDLSYGAALKLGFADQGTAKVRVEALVPDGMDDHRDNPTGKYRFLQLGAFGSEASAERLRRQVEAYVAAPLTVTPVDTNNGRLFRLRAGPYRSEAALLQAQGNLLEAGLPKGQPLP